MPKITIKNLNNIIISTGQSSNIVLDVIHENYIDWMHTCGKKGNCTTCKMIVIQGLENLSSLSENEERFKQTGRLGTNERLACQARIKGDIIIEVPETYKLPHIKYS